MEVAAVRRTLASYVTDWQGLLRGHVHQAQQVLRRLVKGRLTFTPHVTGGKARGYYTFAGTGTVQPLLAGFCGTSGVPTGIRTRVLALKGPRPRPLDDGDERQDQEPEIITRG